MPKSKKKPGTRQISIELNGEDIQFVEEIAAQFGVTVETFLEQMALPMVLGKVPTSKDPDVGGAETKSTRTASSRPSVTKKQGPIRKSGSSSSKKRGGSEK